MSVARTGAKLGASFAFKINPEQGWLRNVEHSEFGFMEVDYRTGLRVRASLSLQFGDVARSLTDIQGFVRFLEGRGTRRAKLPKPI